MKFTPALTSLAIGASLLALTACSGSDEPETPASPTETVEAPAPEPTPSETEESPAPEDDAATASGDVTAPGTELSTSEDFTVALREGVYNTETEEVDHTEAIATYSFDGIREGNPDDLSDVFGDDDLATIAENALYYVDYTVTLAGGPLEDAAASITDITSLDIVDTAGGPNLGNFIFFDGGPEICAYADGGALSETGTTAACQIVMVSSGQSIERLEFNGDTSGGNESDYDGNPVTWLVD